MEIWKWSYEHKCYMREDIWYCRVRLVEAFQNVQFPFLYLSPLKTLLQKSATYVSFTYVIEHSESFPNMSLSHP